MTFDFSTINWLAVLVAAVAAFVIGFLWHGPLFGKQWMAMMEIPQSKIDEMKAKGMGAMAPQMLAAFVQQIVIATAVSWLANALSVTDVTGAVMLGAFLWFSFIASVLLNTVLWEGRKMNLYLFSIAHHLVTLVVVALIIVLWQ